MMRAIAARKHLIVFSRGRAAPACPGILSLLAVSLFGRRQDEAPSRHGARVARAAKI